MSQEVLKRYEKFLRISKEMRPWDMMRARATYYVAWIFVGLQVLNLAGMWYTYRAWTSDHWASLGCIVAFLATAHLLRWVKFPPFYVAAFGVFCLGGLIVASEGAGIHSALLPFIVVAPMMAAFIGGWRSSLVLYGFATLVLLMQYSITLSGSTDYPGWTPGPAQQRLFQAFFALTLATSLSAALSYGGERALQSFEKAWRRAERAAQAKSEFLAVMSHELRTPMNGVLGLTEALLSRGPGPLLDRQNDLLVNVKGSGEHLLALLNDVLDFSKIEAGKIAFDPRPFDLRVLLATVQQTFRETANGKGLSLDLEIADDIPRRVVGDDQRLRQVLSNLVSNAIKFTETGSVTVRVGRPDRSQLRFGVIDTGKGITPEAAGTLFKPFEQGEQDTSRRYGGTGLGLSISDQLCTLMGGAIELVRSTPGETEFAVTLPLQEAAEQTSDEPASSLQFGGFDGLRVLVAEDHAVNRLVLGEFLRAWGAVPVFAEDGAEALEILEAADFDILLTDRHMPKLDGEGLVRAIRGRSDSRRNLPIIAVTADAMEIDQTAMIEVGVNGFVPKPLKPDTLKQAIEQVLGGAEQSSRQEAEV
ncbi:response regulator [Parvularcula sp. ZS-1/3]|uniref:histidine kinase n=1 Tax=Parvularcula mediterranea TaxID=2732508 RepID=A0A7Y3RJG2_9PROT|nr:ATP-binding protein [Parvularcula mediterranea]NNU15197.1 response regulator [Parvularcula mediterranea]